MSRRFLYGRELYITAAALAAGLLVGLSLLGLSGFVAAGIAVVAGFILRGIRNRPWLVSTGLPRLGLPHCSMDGMRVR